jgi:hypothetical protein
MTLQHIVLFQFPADLSVDDDREIRRQVASWPHEIAVMGRVRFGTDLTGDRSRGYQYLLYTEFEDDAALQVYRDHPVHQHFFSWITERDCTVLAFDYHLDPAHVFGPEPELVPEESA